MITPESREKFIDVDDLTRVCEDLEIFPKGEVPIHIKQYRREWGIMWRNDLIAGMQMLSLCMAQSGLDSLHTGRDDLLRLRFQEKYGAPFRNVKDWEVAFGGKYLDEASADYPRTRRDHILDSIYLYGVRASDGKGIEIDEFVDDEPEYLGEVDPTTIKLFYRGYSL